MDQLARAGAEIDREREAAPDGDIRAIARALQRVARPFHLSRRAGRWAVVESSGAANGDPSDGAWVPPCRLEDLGDPDLLSDHRLRYPYVAGAMANGVGSAEIVIAMARAGMIGFFGAAGLPLERVEGAIDRVQSELGVGESDPSYGFNLIHSPHEPGLESGDVDLYLRRGVRRVSASAYLDLTPHVVRYRLAGIHRDAGGRVVAPNWVFAKVSRIEVARRFFSPAPEKILRELVASRALTAEQAELAAFVPIARDLTAEADSGGHTDNQPFVTLLPTMLTLRDELQARFNYDQPLRVGAAGGIGSPAAAAAAFAMGAAYILTGSINQSCREAGTSDSVKKLLAEVSQSDVAMAPAADMFEMGVRVQVLKRGTMFPMRAAKLYELYRAHESLEAIPAPQLAALERDFFRLPLAEVWAQTQSFFRQSDPAQLARAERDPKHKMALVFRWYLGQSSNWANAGVPERRMDYQIWCGPAMGAFNQWVKGSALEAPERREVATVALNLLFGAAVLTRVQTLRSQGVALPAELARVAPLTAQELKERLH
jgi:PfaD family protein